MEANDRLRPTEEVRARRSGFVALVALLAVVGCTGDASPARGSTLPSMSATGAALEPLVTDDLPAGYEPASDSAEDTGPTDLDMAAFLIGDPDEQRVLSELQFRRGYRRLFYGPDGSGDLIVHVYEFCDAQGGAGYLRHTRERLLSPLWGSMEIENVGMAEPGVALLQEADPGDESFVAILRVDGRFYVEIGAYGRLAHESLDTLIATAHGLSDAQLAELP